MLTGAVHLLSHTLTAEVPGDSDLRLQRVDLRVDGDATVVSHPEGLHHSLLQSLCHVLLCHVEDPQVRKTDRHMGSTSEETSVCVCVWFLFVCADLMADSLGSRSAMQIPLSHCFPTRL